MIAFVSRNRKKTGRHIELLRNMNFYLNRYGFQGPFIKNQPEPNLNLVVVIPCHNESALIASLESIKKNSLTDFPVEVIVVINAGINHPDSVKKQNEQTFEEAKTWSEKNNSTHLNFYPILLNDLPAKHAGVGLARKIGMDEAVYRLDLVENDGVIVCFDADSLCEENYLTAIENHFKSNSKIPGCSIFYEHPLSGEEYAPEIYEGIVNYELHLRYYNLALKYCGLPYAFHTVGSSMAVRSSAYQKQGGMNKRKAGEDFYFIHKIIELGNFSNLTQTKVIPSPRISDRVPFGTGKAIGDWVASNASQYLTYNFESFEIIKRFVQIIPQLREKDFSDIYIDDIALNHYYAYLESQNFDTHLSEIRKNSKTEEAFQKRFFRWFDAFQVLKFVHFLRDNQFKNSPIEIESIRLMNAINILEIPTTNREKLVALRKLEQSF